MMAKAFPDETLDPVAGDGPADPLLADRQTEPARGLRHVLRSGVGKHREETVAGAAGASEDPFELRSLAQTSGTVEAGA